MMNQSLMAIHRKSAGGCLPFYCNGGVISSPGAQAPKVTAAVVSPRPEGGPAAASRCQPPTVSRPSQLQYPLVSASYKLEALAPRPLVGRQEDDGDKMAEWRPQLANGRSHYAGSTLPSTPPEDDLEEEESMSSGSMSPLPSPTARDKLHVETLQLLLRYFQEYAGGVGGGQKAALFFGPPVDHKALDTLRRVGGDIIEKHKLVFQGMLQKLSIRSSEDLKVLSDVPSTVFNDGITNWGRIVTLISFGAFIAKYLKSINLEDSIVPLAESFTDFLMASKRDWIIQQKAWDGFIEFFHIEDYESGLRTVLMAVAGVAGLGASLAYMIR
ncbi:hypothetical protein FKM82_016167 [Ascaphus truei]|uniref:induced myeloid leukemia cell differentiation protein Mcl-1 n=1 Tax=Ascaphus truei TaxID=8439 RepID=UPI003F595959